MNVRSLRIDRALPSTVVSSWTGRRFTRIRSHPASFTAWVLSVCAWRKGRNTVGIAFPCTGSVYRDLVLLNERLRRIDQVVTILSLWVKSRCVDCSSVFLISWVAVSRQQQQSRALDFTSVCSLPRALWLPRLFWELFLGSSFDLPLVIAALWTLHGVTGALRMLPCATRCLPVHEQW